MLDSINLLIARLVAPVSKDDERGQSLIEYGLIVALVSIVAIATLTTVGANANNLFKSLANKLHS